MTDTPNQTAAVYTVVYDVRGDRQKHDEWWRMIHRLQDGISVKASASFDALAKLDELEGEADMASTEHPDQTAEGPSELPTRIIAELVGSPSQISVRPERESVARWLWTLLYVHENSSGWRDYLDQADDMLQTIGLARETGEVRSWPTLRTKPRSVRPELERKAAMFEDVAMAIRQVLAKFPPQ